MDSTSLLANNTFILLALIWILPWKGFALWKASRNEHKWLFVVILLTNTFALLDALYILYFSKRKKRDKKKEKTKTTKSSSSDTSKKVIRKKA